MKKIFILFLLSFLSVATFSQKRKIQIVSANKMVGDREIRKLYGNVIFKHKEALMYCDSAYFYAKDNRFIAFSNVKIEDNSVTITADTLHYNSVESLAKLRGSVKLVDGQTQLTTHFLDYRTKERVGYYYGHGDIIDHENTLSSERGFYYANSNELYFKNNVTLNNSDYRIETDTLKYHTKSETSFFLGPSFIYSDENTLYTENGWYKSNEAIAQFYENSYILTGPRYIYGNNLYYDKKTKIGKARNSVLIKDTVERISIYGDIADYNGNMEEAFMTGNLTMIQEFDTDSLFLHSDSIYLKTFYTHNDTLPTDSTRYNLIKTYNKVRFFKSDIQGVSDSLVYNSQDSTITLFSVPVLWSEEHQITGSKIVLELVENKISRIKIPLESFVISQNSPVQFNQMKGTSLVGFIKNNELYRIDISNNGETIYFLKDKSKTIGVNVATCDSITMYIKDGKAQQIVFKSKPNGTLFPPNELPKNSQKLADFIWLDYIRPRNPADIYEWRMINNN